MADIVYKVVLENAGVNAFTMPGGYWEDVEIHCWGAGGGKGRGGAFGGGGGYAKVTVNINEGDEVSLQIGQPGTNGGYPAGGRGGSDPSYKLFRGGNSADAQDEDGDTGAGGGGGGASWVAVNDTYVCVGAGGGGAGGYGDDGSGGFAGLPGGVTTNGLNTNTSGGDAPLGWSTGGGGGAGYPKGGAAGTSYGDDAGNPPSGSGGQNYGNVTVAGSGTLPGGTTVSYYPGNRRGEANYPGYIVMVLRKKLNVSIKDAKGDGTWANVASAYVKLPATSYTVYSSPAGSTTYTSPGTYSFTVPDGVTSLNTTVVGGSGGGGGGGAGAGQTGGTSYKDIRTITVIPNETITITVGAGGQGGRSGTSNCGSNGVNWAAINNDPSSRRGQGGAGYASGSEGSGAGCYGSGQPDGGWAGGGGGSSALTYSGGTVIAGGGAGGNGGARPVDGATGTGGSGGNSGTGNQGATGVAGGNGLSAQYGATYGGNGEGGRVIISYAATPIATATISTGGWKQIQAAWTKVNNAWKPILTDKDIILYNYIVKRKKANIIVSSDTTNYDLYNNIPVDYFEGLMDIDVWVLPNVTIRGSSTAFTVRGFNEGDRIILHNYGYLAGQGGTGGAGGSRYTTTSGKYLTTTVVPPSAGGRGGTGLKLEYPIILLNDGIIAGGGGGGGGGSETVTSNFKSPTYSSGGRGGGGAGFGSGANNGTLTSGGAGEVAAGGDGGAGGGRGQSGVSGVAGATGGGAGGAAGYAIQGITRLITGSNVGSTFGPVA